MWQPLSKRVAAVVVAGLCLVTDGAAQTTTQVLWEFPHVAPASVSATPLITRLRREVQRILDAGPCLLPAYAYHGDLPGNEQYWIYTTPGRIITTLAWAYPYLTAAQQAAVTTYVQTELTKANFRPWDAPPLAPETACGSASATRRELFPMLRRTYMTYAPFGNTYPSVQTIYGLWLWGWRVGGNWSVITPYAASIRSMYDSRAGQGNIYGTMGAHVGMARLAEELNWTGYEATATANLTTQLASSFATVESRVSGSYWSMQYISTAKQAGQYLGWMFLDVSPEIARWLATVSSAVTRHTTAGIARYPWWWMRQAPYMTKMTGQQADTEATGMTPELIGMIAPLERYMMGRNAATMESYTRSGPLVIGDLYWIELLVYAIEASGTTTWVDVRNGQP